MRRRKVTRKKHRGAAEWSQQRSQAGRYNASGPRGRDVDVIADNVPHVVAVILSAPCRTFILFRSK